MILRGRKTHSVHNTYDEADKAAYRLIYHILNGCPIGYIFYIIPRMGKFALISCLLDQSERK